MDAPATSDAASTLSGSTAYSIPKDPKQRQDAGKPARRGMRQRVRDVVSDLGRPPTARQDAKEGKATKNHVDIGPVGAGVMGGSATA